MGLSCACISATRWRAGRDGRDGEQEESHDLLHISQVLRLRCMLHVVGSVRMSGGLGIKACIFTNLNPIPSPSHLQLSTVYLGEVVRKERGTSQECSLPPMLWHSCACCPRTGSCGTHSTVQLGGRREALARAALCSAQTCCPPCQSR